MRQRLVGALGMNTLIHVPHASIEIPSDVRSQFLLADSELRREAIE